MPYVYRDEILVRLLAHGVRPSGRTPPERAKAQVSDLYRYELRKLRDCLLRREIVKQEYSTHVMALRKRYLVLSVPLDRWTKARE